MPHDSTANNLSPKAAAILKQQLAASGDFFMPLLKSVLEETEETLFQRAGRSRDNTEQQQHMAAVAALKNNRQVLIKRALTPLPARINPFGTALHLTPSAPKQVSLSLLSKQHQDESVILEDLSARAEARATLTLFELGHRYALLAARPVMETCYQPFSPQVFCDCVRRATDQIDLSPEHKAVLFQTFSKHFLLEAFAFYDKLNAQLCEYGLLPNLKIFALKRQKSASLHHQFDESGDTPTADAGMAANDNPAPADEPAAAKAPLTTAATPAAGQTAAPGQHAEQERFASLSQLLTEQRRPAGAVGQAPAAATLNNIFQQLQQEPATVHSDSGELQPRNMQQLRDELVSQLQASSPDGKPPAFSPQQHNAMDLMTMLFERLSHSIHSDSGNYLLSELQAPLLRLSMDDSSFFTNRQHPARNWLEKVALASCHWGPEGDQSDTEVALVRRIHAMNRAINRDFDGDPAIFDGMANDLQQQLKQLAHRAKVAEKRSVESSQGRVRLLLARRQAESLVAERLRQHPGSVLSHSLQKHAWIDVLTLSLLRHGRGSEELDKKLATLDRLINEQNSNTEGGRNQLCSAIESTFSQAGMDMMEACLLAKEAVGIASSHSKEEQAAREELQERLEQQHHEAQQQPDQLVEPASTPIDQSAIAAKIEEIKHMEFGTWFEYDDPESDKPLRRKLAWFSPKAGHCLFVNRHGLRTHETTLELLAESMLSNQVRVAPPEHKAGFIERALDSILASLKKVGGQKPLEGSPA